MRRYSERTQEAYVLWARRFILFHGKRHPAAMGADEVNGFLTSLAVDSRVSASTQTQALCAILFLYRVVLGDALPWIDDLVRAKRPARLPVVLTRDEVASVLRRIVGTPNLVGRLLYGSGLRLLEALRLRVKDVDIARRQILVRDPKGRRDRATMLPGVLIEPLQGHLRGVRALHEADRSDGFGAVWLPDAIGRKLPPARARSGSGSGSFRRRVAGATRRPARSGGTTCTRARCSVRSSEPRWRRTSASG